MARIQQFNWRRQWSKRVAQHLNNEIVQASLDMGVAMLDANCERGKPPYWCGRLGFGRVVKGKLSWYQPWARCHWIAFFSMAIGVLNYPDLDWRFVTGDLHTVPVGYTRDGHAKVVMDILLYAEMTAEESIALAGKKLPRAPSAAGWAEAHLAYIDHVVPALRRAAPGKLAA